MVIAIRGSGAGAATGGALSRRTLAGGEGANAVTVGGGATGDAWGCAVGCCAEDDVASPAAPEGAAPAFGAESCVLGGRGTAVWREPAFAGRCGCVAT